jgi:tetratricopeptide (TPR) repeat protein
VNDDQHHETLRQLLTDESSVGSERFLALLVHLTQECSECRRILQQLESAETDAELPWDDFPELFEETLQSAEEFPRFQEEQRFREARARNEVLERSAREALARQAAFQREEAEAKGLLEELLSISSTKSRQAAAGEARFQTRSVVEALLDEARARWFDAPSEAVELVEVALLLLGQLDPRRYGRDVIADVAARSWAFKGNAHRLQDQHAAAEQAFERARMLLTAGTGDPLAQAEVLSLRASLLIDQRRFDTAHNLLQKSVRIYRDIGESHLEARTLLKQSHLYEVHNQSALAVGALERALQSIDTEREPLVELIARHNLIGILSKNQRADEARRILEESADLYERFRAPWVERRTIWLEGMIALGLDELELAEERLERARGLYDASGEVYYWALVSLDLALVLAAEQRTAELKALAETLFNTFKELEIHREAFASLLLFYRSAQSEEISSAVVGNLITALKRYPYTPKQKPS